MYTTDSAYRAVAPVIRTLVAQSSFYFPLLHLPLMLLHPLVPPPGCIRRPRLVISCSVPPTQFIIRVLLQYFLAGWHIKPKGVKKP